MKKNPYYLILELKVAESSVLNGHNYWTNWHCLINLVFKKFGSKFNYYPMCSRLTYSSRIRIRDCAYALTNLVLNPRLRKYPKRDWIRDQALLDSRFLDRAGIPADLCGPDKHEMRLQQKYFSLILYKFYLPFFPGMKRSHSIKSTEIKLL